MFSSFFSLVLFSALGLKSEGMGQLVQLKGGDRMCLQEERQIGPSCGGWVDGATEGKSGRLSIGLQNNM